MLDLQMALVKIRPGTWSAPVSVYLVKRGPIMPGHYHIRVVSNSMTYTLLAEQCTPPSQFSWARKPCDDWVSWALCGMWYQSPKDTDQN